jgi:hypothetical protein
MANPNIAGLTDIYGKLANGIATTSAVGIITNAASSGKIFKINTFMVANTDGVNAADVSVQVVNNGSAYYIAWTVSVPSDATLVLISKDTSIYLPENSSINIHASASNDLQWTCSYEEIS